MTPTCYAIGCQQPATSVFKSFDTRDYATARCDVHSIILRTYPHIYVEYPITDENLNQINALLVEVKLVRS